MDNSFTAVWLSKILFVELKLLLRIADSFINLFGFHC